MILKVFNIQWKPVPSGCQTAQFEKLLITNPLGNISEVINKATGHWPLAYEVECLDQIRENMVVMGCCNIVSTDGVNYVKV